MRQYLDILEKAKNGLRKENRTDFDHYGYHGDMMKFNLADGFPAVTTKKLAFKSVVAEMLCFLRGYSNVNDFNKMGCKVWDANADADYWTNNPHCKGNGDLGRIYGVQARGWMPPRTHPDSTGVDQLKKVYNHLKAGIDDRREIVTHWNPGELDKMALPPCHLLYQFGIQGRVLNLTMYQRSCDVPLGIPFNIAGYAWLLSVMAKITGLIPGTFTHMMHDIHVYENQFDLIDEQLSREPMKLPRLLINPDITCLEDLETWVMPDDFTLDGYEHHQHIKYPFAV